MCACACECVCTYVRVSVRGGPGVGYSQALGVKQRRIQAVRLQQSVALGNPPVASDLGRLTSRWLSDLLHEKIETENRGEARARETVKQ